MDAKIRLYVKNQLCDAQIISLERNQANYLFAVMRQAFGNQILIFNNCDGEWLAEIIDGGGGGKKSVSTAGGKDVSKLQEAIDKSILIIKEMIDERF